MNTTVHTDQHRESLLSSRSIGMERGLGGEAPPRWPLKFLRLFLKAQYLEEIEGDMEEIFFENVERVSLRKAKWLYTVEMFKLLRPSLMKNTQFINSLNQYDMLRNYFKVSVRGLMKNPLSSFINVFGLSVAVGICLVVYAFLKFDRSIDQFHENKNEVYLSTFFANHDGVTHQYGTSPRPLGELLKSDFPAITNMCRIDDASAVVKYGDNAFHEHVRFVDPTFLSMFTFPLKWGSPKSLNDLNSIILSEDASIKYFGDENPIGRELQIIFKDSVSKVFTVNGVAQPFPKPHAIDFSFLVNFENMRVAHPGYDVSTWHEPLSATLIQVPNPTDLPVILQGMDKYKALQNKSQPDWVIERFAFEPLATLHANSANIEDDISFDENREGRIGMPTIALFMLALACFNYINIAIVSAAKRLKEIGVRKVIGANRSKVIFQFLSENIVITFFALVIGCLLGYFFFVPWFVQFTDWPLEVHLTDLSLWTFLAALLLFTGVASGIYPAFYISRFETVQIFKGSMRFGQKNPITKIFLATQLVLACICITAAVVFTQNNKYQNNLSWGYEQRGLVYTNTLAHSAYEKMNAAMAQNPNVVMASGSIEHVGKFASKTVLRMPPNQMFEVQRFSVDANYFETLRFELLEGRSFKNHPGSDKQSLVVNEVFVKNADLKKPIGAQFELDSVQYEVIGVVKDFHTRNFFNKVDPIIFTVANEQDLRFLTLRVREGAENETYAAMQAEWKKLYPEVPFVGGHQEDVWSLYFHRVNRSEEFNKVIAFIAVMLASMGLYGLVTLNVAGRVREFSIRKTLGASVSNIASNIIGQYVLLVVVAIVIGAPISYIFTKAYLDMIFAYPMPMDLSGITISLILLVLVFLAVVSTQVGKVAKANPVEGLKVE